MSFCAARLVHLSQDRSISLSWRLVVSLCLIGVSARRRPRRPTDAFRLINGGSGGGSLPSATLHPPHPFSPLPPQGSV